jgi:UDP-N-acetylglucosamine acyltransferase
VSHVILDGKTRLGARNRVYSFACLGVAPQDLKYRGEATALEIGNDNTIREYVTISRGTQGGGGTTRVGSHCLIMAYTHIGHDSTIGNHCILANGATLAGHVIVEDNASVGALCPVHQFCCIGKHAYVGGGTTITQDVLPFSLTSARRETHAYSLNRIGLERSGFSAPQLKALQHAYRILLAAKLNTSQALERLRGEGELEGCVEYLVAFIERSQRGVIK